MMGSGGRDSFENVVVHVSSEALDELHVVDGLRHVIVSFLPDHSDLTDDIIRRLLNELENDVIHFKSLHHVTF